MNSLPGGTEPQPHVQSSTTVIDGLIRTWELVRKSGKFAFYIDIGFVGEAVKT